MTDVKDLKIEAHANAGYCGLTEEGYDGMGGDGARALFRADDVTFAEAARVVAIVNAAAGLTAEEVVSRLKREALPEAKPTRVLRGVRQRQHELTDEEFEEFGRLYRSGRQWMAGEGEELRESLVRKRLAYVEGGKCTLTARGCGTYERLFWDRSVNAGEVASASRPIAARGPDASELAARFEAEAEKADTGVTHARGNGNSDHATMAKTEAKVWRRAARMVRGQE